VSAFAPIGPPNSAAVRQFHQGETMRYSFVIYNPHLDPATGQPQLQTIFRDGHLFSPEKRSGSH
jgi:hypothetical protein